MLSCLNFIINSTFCQVFITKLQDVVATYLEMFNCVSAKQTVAMSKSIFFRNVSNVATCCVRHFAAEAAKVLANLIKSWYIR